MSARRKFAWVLIASSLVGWPMTALTVASGEPQVILGLSWLAPIYTAIGILFTAEVKEEQDA